MRRSPSLFLFLYQQCFKRYFKCVAPEICRQDFSIEVYEEVARNLLDAKLVANRRVPTFVVAHVMLPRKVVSVDGLHPVVFAGVERNAENLKTIALGEVRVLVSLVTFYEVGVLGTARRTPRRPKINKYRLIRF